MAIPSPCIDVCRFDRQTGYCVGCLRTREEAYSWREMTDVRRRRILGDVPQRRAKLAIDTQLDQRRR
jgi:hypothetical protein